MGHHAMKVGIVGSRRRNTQADYQKVYEVFCGIYQKERPPHIVSGGCPQGADRFAEVIAKQLQLPITIYYAKWNVHGKAAGFIRNTDIAETVDVLIACVADDRTGGTEDTITKFLNSNKLTEEEAREKGCLILV